MNKYYIILDITEDKVVFKKENYYTTSGPAPNLTNLAIELRLGPLLHVP